MAISPLICQYVLGFILESDYLDSVLVSQYMDHFLVGGYNTNRGGAAAEALRERAGTTISIKSVLEPVPEIPWLGKRSKFL